MKQYLDIQMERRSASQTKPEQDQLGFGIHFTDHMFMMDYTTKNGWHMRG